MCVRFHSVSDRTFHSFSGLRYNERFPLSILQLWTTYKGMLRYCQHFCLDRPGINCFLYVNHLGVYLVQHRTLSITSSVIWNAKKVDPYKQPALSLCVKHFVYTVIYAHLQSTQSSHMLTKHT